MQLEVSYETEDLLMLQRQVQEAAVRILNAHFYEPELNGLMRQFVSYKQAETSIWPKLTLYTHFMMGGASPHIVHSAAQTELIILSLDIFDDLQDQDNFEPPWMDCEHAIAMNAASALLTAAIAGDSTAPQLGPSILKLITAAHNGQHKDIRNLASNEEDYLQLIGEKSAALIALAIQMGYSTVDNPEGETITLLNEMAQQIGIAAQVENDSRNITVVNSRNDLIQRKKTLAALFLLEQGDSSFPLLREYYNGNSERQELLAREQDLLAFIRSSGVVEYSKAVQLLYAKQAEQKLDLLAIHAPWKNVFKEIAIAPFLK